MVQRAWARVFTQSAHRVRIFSKSFALSCSLSTVLGCMVVFAEVLSLGHGCIFGEMCGSVHLVNGTKWRM